MRKEQKMSKIPKELHFEMTDPETYNYTQLVDVQSVSIKLTDEQIELLEKKATEKKYFTNVRICY